MQCWDNLINTLSCVLFLVGVSHLVRLTQAPYGRYLDLGLSSSSSMPRMMPARLAWFLQELPSLLVPLMMMTTTPNHTGSSLGTSLLLGTFCLHYFQRTFVYSVLMRGRPFPLHVMIEAGLFCSLNGFTQSHYLVHCAHYHPTWTSDTRFLIGSTLFLLGMAINVHSDYLLRNLRQPGEVVYKIPKGGLFHYVSGANYFGEIVEWLGYAIATWSLTTFSFAFCSLCFIGRRAFHHHRFYHEKFHDYPRSRKALIPFVF